MNIVVFQHQTAGILCVVTENILALSDEQIGALVSSKIKKDYPQLVAGLGLEGYEQTFVQRDAKGNIRLEIVGDEAVLYVSLTQFPLHHIQEERSQLTHHTPLEQQLAHAI
jgi:hypothetical protein